MVNLRKDIFVNDKQTYFLLYLISNVIEGSFISHKDFKGFVSIHSNLYINKCNTLRFFRKIKNFDKVFDCLGDSNLCNNYSEITFGYRLKPEIFKEVETLPRFKRKRLYKKDSFKNVIKYKGEDKLYDTVKDLIIGENITQREYEKNKERYITEIKEIFSLPTNVEFPKKTSYYDYKHNFEVNWDKVEELRDLYLSDKIDYNTITQTDMIQVFKLRELKRLNLPLEVKYLRKSGGRLNNIYQEGNCCFQSVSKEARKYVFKGFWSYDIEVSAPTVLQALCQKYLGYKMKVVQDYIDNKEKYRQDLVNLGLTYKEAKQFFVSIFFGASLNENFYLYNSSVLNKTFGVTKIRQIMDGSKIVVELYSELSSFIKKFGKYLKENKVSVNKNGKKALYNSRGAGKEVDLNKWNNPKSLLFYYFGVESQILDCVIKKYQHSLLLFDGFISKEDIDTAEMSALVKKELGFDIKFSKEVI